MKLLDRIYEREIKKAIDLGNPEQIYDSSSINKKINYTIVYLKTDNGKTNLLVKGYTGNTLHCERSEWIDSENVYSIVNISIFESKQQNIDIRRYYKDRYKGYTNGNRFAIEHLTKYFYIEYWCKLVKEKIFSQKRIETDRSIVVLKNFKKIYDKGYKSIPLHEYLKLTHSDLFIILPNDNLKLEKLKLVLDYLVEEGYLKQDENGFSYIISGKGLSKIIEYEEEVRKHKSTAKREMLIIALTCVLAFSGLAQLILTFR